jgi:hypothetical protein
MRSNGQAFQVGTQEIKMFPVFLISLEILDSISVGSLEDIEDITVAVF